MDVDRPRQVVDAFEAFFQSGPEDSGQQVVELFQQVAASVPAYQNFLRDKGIEPSSIRTVEDFRRLPLLDKDSYHRRYPLPELCRDGRLDGCDMIAVSSGSSGSPTIWPRSLRDELHITRRFEQVFRDGFHADGRSTLAVVGFPLGTWVGGLLITACVRHLAAKGYPITVVAPGNNKAEILRVLPELAPHFEQVVLLGYPPFVKDVVDTGLAAGFDWSRHTVTLVLAGEVFSEEWRDLMAERAGLGDPTRDSVSLYGTADAGVLGNETPLSVTIRRFLAARPELARELFGDSRLPTLVQYDPRRQVLRKPRRHVAVFGRKRDPADSLPTSPTKAESFPTKICWTSVPATGSTRSRPQARASTRCRSFSSSGARCSRCRSSAPTSTRRT
jgi:phenylacetate-CoA ligase